MTAPLRRVLYAEDDPDIQEVARLALEAVGGFTVLLCGSGGEAIRQAPRFAPDLILLDVMMPDMDGPSTLSALRQIPETKSTPVVFITAKVQPQEVSEYQRLGALDVIFKPFDPMSLAESLQGVWARVHGRH